MNKKLCIICGEELSNNEKEVHPECDINALQRSSINPGKLSNLFMEDRRYLRKRKRGTDDRA